MELYLKIAILVYNILIWFNSKNYLFFYSSSGFNVIAFQFPIFFSISVFFFFFIILLISFLIILYSNSFLDFLLSTFWGLSILLLSLEFASSFPAYVHNIIIVFFLSFTMSTCVFIADIQTKGVALQNVSVRFFFKLYIENFEIACYIFKKWKKR